MQAGGHRFDPGWLHSRKSLQVYTSWRYGADASAGSVFLGCVPHVPTPTGFEHQLLIPKVQGSIPCGGITKGPTNTGLFLVSVHDLAPAGGNEWGNTSARLRHGGDCRPQVSRDCGPRSGRSARGINAPPARLMLSDHFPARAGLHGGCQVVSQRGGAAPCVDGRDARGTGKLHLPAALQALIDARGWRDALVILAVILAVVTFRWTHSSCARPMGSVTRRTRRADCHQARRYRSRDDDELRPHPFLLAPPRVADARKRYSRSATRAAIVNAQPADEIVLDVELARLRRVAVD